MIYEVKLKEAMGRLFEELVKAAAIENRLTGTVKLANEERNPDYGKDQDVQLMSGQNAKGGDPRGQAAAAPGARMKMPPPAALSPDAAKQFEKLNRPLKPGTTGGTATTTAPAAAAPSSSSPTTPAAAPSSN